MDPILRKLAEAADIKLSKDQEALTEEQTATLEQYLEAEAKKVTDLGTKVGLLETKLSDQDPQAQKLAEAGFTEEAALLLEYKADKEISAFEEKMGEGKILSPATKDLIRESVVDANPAKFAEAFALVAEGDGVVDTSEEGHEHDEGDGGEGSANKAGDKINKLATKLAKSEEISLSEAYDRVAEDEPALWNEHQRAMGGSQHSLVEVI